MKTFLNLTVQKQLQSSQPDIHTYILACLPTLLFALLLLLLVLFIDEQSGALMIRDYDVAMPALLCHKEPAQGKLKCRNIPDMGGIYCLMATYHAITTT